MSDWNGWLSVGDIAKSASCSRNLKHLIEHYSVETEIDLGRKFTVDYGNQEPGEKIIFGKVAEDIIQFIMTGNTPNEILSRGEQIINWFNSIIVIKFIQGRTKSQRVMDLDPPWVVEEKDWMTHIGKWNLSKFNEMKEICENWVVQSTHLGFNELSWSDEYNIRVNLQLGDGRFLPISGRMDLRSTDSQKITIVEIKTTMANKRSLAYFQAETYAEMEFIKGQTDVESFVYHDKKIQKTENAIRNLIDTANYDDFNPSFENCRYCTNIMCPDAKRSN